MRKLYTLPFIFLASQSVTQAAGGIIYNGTHSEIDTAILYAPIPNNDLDPAGLRVASLIADYTGGNPTGTCANTIVAIVRSWIASLRDSGKHKSAGNQQVFGTACAGYQGSQAGKQVGQELDCKEYGIGDVSCRTAGTLVYRSIAANNLGVKVNVASSIVGVGGELIGEKLGEKLGGKGGKKWIKIGKKAGGGIGSVGGQMATEILLTKTKKTKLGKQVRASNKIGETFGTACAGYQGSQAGKHVAQELLGYEEGGGVDISCRTAGTFVSRSITASNLGGVVNGASSVTGVGGELIGEKLGEKWGEKGKKVGGFIGNIGGQVVTELAFSSNCLVM